MPRLRVLMLWLLLLALPFQGAAASAMLACGVARPAAAAAAHEETGHHAGHAMHAHDAPLADASGHHGHQPAQGEGSNHKCSACSVCHAAALLDMPAAAEPHALPQATPVAHFDAVASVSPRAPDKPPRA